MKFVTLFIFLMMTWIAQAQDVTKHPRVMELEDKLSREASQYFSRRYPQDPFLIKVDVTPLRRQNTKSVSDENLPYHDYESDEIVDEWDDPTTSLSFLRNRVVKVIVEVSVPLNFDEQKVIDLKQEISVYLRLVPVRDDVRVEKKLRVQKTDTPNYAFYLMGSLLLASVIIGLMMKWSLKNLKNSNASASASSNQVAQYEKPSAMMETSSGGSKGISGDVVFHDPIKTLEIVHIKMKQIEESGTFPNLRDLMSLDELGKSDASKLGALVFELSHQSQKTLFRMGNNTHWLQAYNSPGKIDQSCLDVLEKMSRERELSSGNRAMEDLLIVAWRLDDKAVSYFKSLDQEHSFLILNHMPKMFSISVAKKAFPGSWGKLLENHSSNITIDPKLVKEYTARAISVLPWFEEKMLVEYKQDKEILSYLNFASIEDERDVYESLKSDSFIHKVRPPFYKVFSLESEQLASLIPMFPLEMWALVVMNSSRSNIRIISDKLDAKKRMVFSTHLKRYDNGSFSLVDQAHWRKLIAREADSLNVKQLSKDSMNESTTGKEIEDTSKSA